MKAIAQHINRSQVTPGQVLVLGYLAVISVGVALLLLPLSSTPGRPMSVVDAIFMATSAVSITGLTVKDLPVDLTVFGQVVILLLIQIGGLGYMTSATVLALILGQRIGLRDRLIMQEAFNAVSLDGLIRITWAILVITLLVESVGAVLLAWRFAETLPMGTAVYFAVFHSVAAFNNAGFSLFSDNLMGFRSDVPLNFVVTTITIIGSLGVIVYSDLYKYGRREVLRISLHTKLVLSTTAILIILPTILFVGLEWSNSKSLANLSIGERMMASYFQMAGTRLAGFNTIDISGLHAVTLYMMILLMFIGGSPGGTAGGIKTTTFATMAVALWATMRGREDATVFHRRLAPSTVARAFLLTVMGFALSTAVTLIILSTEKRIFLNTLFEVMSAFGTVGVSMGNGGTLSFSALFSDVGKLLISFTMFVGRVGPLTVGAAIVHPHSLRYRVPEDRCLIG